MTYKGCTITRTNTSTSVRRGGKEHYVGLLRIDGRLEKREGLRPLITTLADARQWINDQDLVREWHSRDRDGEAA